MTVLETTRLLLRPFADSDLDDYAALMGDADVVRHLGDGRPLNRAQAARDLADCREQNAQGAVIEKATGRFLGRGGLSRLPELDGPEVGWILGPAARGLGYATELGLAWRDHAFQVLGAVRLYSVMVPANTASIRVAERIGHRYLHDIHITNIRCLLYGQEPPNVAPFENPDGRPAGDSPARLTGLGCG